MKYCIFPPAFFLFFCSLLSVAQDVKVKNDSIFVDGKLFCVAEGNLMLNKPMNITTAEGKEIGFVKIVYRNDLEMAEVKQDPYCSFIFFTEPQQQADMPYPLSIRKFIGKNFTKENVIVDGQLNAEGVSRFCAKYGKDYGIKRSPETNINITINDKQADKANNLVKRNRTEPVQIFNEDIKQDFNTIGKIRKNSAATNGTIVYNCDISLPNGNSIAAATFEMTDNSTCTIVTASDHKKHQINIDKWIDAEKAIVIYLVDNMYL